MVRVATASTADERLHFVGGAAERLPFDDDAFDLVISTTSFDHWTDQQQGLAECARVLAASGRLVLTDQFSAWLWPTLAGSRRRRARTKARATRLVTRAGLHSPHWHASYAAIIQTVTATK
jgi:ubiquinone/menaquinone biosynthesis C-methylase UbiE